MRLHDFFDYQARSRPDAEFAYQGARRLSFAEADRAVSRIANALLDAGLGTGDRIGLLAKNALEYPLVYLACSRAGVVPVPLNYRLAPPEWQYILADAGAKLVIARGALVSAIEPVRRELPEVAHWVALDPVEEAPDGWHLYTDLTEAASDRAPEREVPETADVYQMYTSGTTGRPKGAVLTHAAVTANLVQTLALFQAPPGSRVLVVAPLYHAAGAITALNATVWGGSLCIHEDFDPGEVVRALDEEEIRNATLVPAMIQACLVGVPDVAERGYESLDLMAYGASPIAEQTLRRAMEVFRCRFAQGYGMTETTAVLTYLMPDDHVRALAGEPELLLSAGRPVVGTRLQIIDPDGKPLPPGEVGEICGRGPQLMRGYWNLPEASAEALAGGWMHTGDAGYLDEEGFLFIQDRTKDMIVSGGENVYPREVEDALFRHPAVADVAVIGIPSERWGEEVKAIVVPKAGTEVTGDELIEHCRTQLAGYKRPRSVDFVEELPRNPSGKVLKRELREPYWRGRERRVS